MSNDGYWGLSRKYPAILYGQWRHLLKIQATRNIVHRIVTPQSPSKLWPSWGNLVIGSGLNQVISNFSTVFLPLWSQKPWNKFCHNTFHAKILFQNLRHSSVWNPQISFLFSHGQSLIFVHCRPYVSNILRCSACCRPSRMWITFQILHHFEVCGSHCYLCCTHFIIPESLLNHPHSFHGGMFKLKAKFDADSLLYLCSHFECDSHTV